MSDETTREVGETSGAAGQQGARLSGSPVGPAGMVSITAYVIALSVLLIYGVVAFWPLPTPAVGTDSSSSTATFLAWTFSIPDESRLFLVVALTGALGSMVHTLRSFYWYIGNRDMVWSWVIMYVLLPFVGATLGLVFYFVIRGGFFSPQTTVQQTSPFGFAALSGLVGLFSEQAVLKLKAVADTLFAKPKPGANARPQDKE